MKRVQAAIPMALGAALLLGPALEIRAQTAGSAFTYQGRLEDGGSPASGPYDFQFVLYDKVVGGTQVGPIVTSDDVAVVQGLFSVSLDFGPGIFEGDARFLEIGVRPGSSAGAYTVLGARQELTPAPHAVFSQVTPWTGISGKPPGFDDDVDDDTTYTPGAGLDLTGTTFSVADLGVTTPKLADDAVTSPKIADGTIALTDLGQNGCTTGQILKWNGSAWACALDANSGGTVTSVGTGAGLTGGPISTTGTVSVATGGITTPLLADAAVTSPKIANGAVGLAQINTAEVQARVGPMCPPGQYLRGINPDGTVVCDPLFAPNVTTSVDDDQVSDLGKFSSIKSGSDGLPVISYYDATAQALKVAHCGNLACTHDNTVTTVDDDPSSDVGQFTSIAIGADGLPVISYLNLTAGSLKVAHCGNVSCTTSNVLTTVDDPANQVGAATSIAIGSDGLPVISYADITAGSLKLAHCGNVSCSTGNVLTTVDDPANTVGGYTSIAIGSDGLPVIGYFDLTAGALKAAHCGDLSCTTGNTITTVDDPANFVGVSPSIAIGSDGLPVISHHDLTAGSLEVAHCGNVSCTAGNVLTTVEDPAHDVGWDTSIAIGGDGLPVISHYDVTAREIRVAHCGNASCTAGNLLSFVADGAAAGSAFTSIAIGGDVPIISYAGAGVLKVTRCATRTCQ